MKIRKIAVPRREVPYRATALVWSESVPFFLYPPSQTDS